jgi:hypothetical protein
MDFFDRYKEIAGNTYRLLELINKIIKPVDKTMEEFIRALDTEYFKTTIAKLMMERIPVRDDLYLIEDVIEYIKYRQDLFTDGRMKYATLEALRIKQNDDPINIKFYEINLDYYFGEDLPMISSIHDLIKELGMRILTLEEVSVLRKAYITAKKLLVFFEPVKSVFCNYCVLEAENDENPPGVGVIKYVINGCVDYPMKFDSIVVVKE